MAISIEPSTQRKTESKKVFIASSSPSESLEHDKVDDKPKIRERIRVKEYSSKKDNVNNKANEYKSSTTDERKRVFPRIKFLDKKSFVKNELIDTEALNVDAIDEEDEFRLTEPVDTATSDNVGEITLEEPSVIDNEVSVPSIEEQVKINAGFEIKIDKDFHLRKPVDKRVIEKNFEFDGIIISSGVLEIMPDGYGFLRSADYNYLNSPDDIYVSQSQIKLFGLKTGDTIKGSIRPPKEGEKYFPLIKVEEINGRDPDFIRDRVPFDYLTPLFPNEKFTLCSKSEASILSVRIVNVFTYW